jgi:hypothetical protein
MTHQHVEGNGLECGIHLLGIRHRFGQRLIPAEHAAVS